MPREATGSADWRRGKDGVECWHARVSMHGSRPWVPMPGIPEGAKDEARQTAARISARMRKTGAVRASTAETVNEYAERWLASRERKKLRTARSDRGRYNKWIAPHLGTRPIADVGKQEIKEVVRALDDAVRAGRLAWKTAVNVWGALTKMFDDSCEAKESDLCVRQDDPTHNVRGPDRGGDRSAAYLFPDEFLQLVRCEGVPLRWRQIYTLATYLYLRGGELAALDWDAVNIDRGYVLIHQSLDSDTRTIKSTKSKRTRKVPIEPTLLPLLRDMHHEADGEGSVVEMPPMCEWAAKLRDHVKLAGLKRADLLADDATRRPLTFHDLRHTGITWRAMRGDAPFAIKDGAGHTDLETTQRYVNEARSFSDTFGEVFPPLPSAIVPESSPGQLKPHEMPGKTASPAGVEPALAT
jgi:integrase